MPEYVIGISTCPVDISKKLARVLVETRACACVNIIPKVTSIYHWKDDVEEDEESVLLMKTEVGRKEELWEALKKEHPYDVPEFVVIPIMWGSQDYLDWISQSIIGK
jgi:periplasmic divalent cation tolerance protein